MKNQHETLPQPLPGVKWLVLLYVSFVVYGSLVPLKYVYRSWDDAILAFQNIPFLALGIESRADWVANGVLYIPLAFLTACQLLQTLPKVPRWLLLAIAGTGCVALAIAVEFAQLYFPQRTVSLNDIVAESIGTLIGLAISAKYVHWFLRLLGSLSGDPHRLRMRMLEGYAIAYVAFAFFPFDILMSWPELQSKIQSDHWGWLVAGHTKKTVLLAFQLAAEVLLAMPFGVLLVRLAGVRGSGIPQGAIIGLLLGTFIEGAQFFLASGISQGLSILSRAVGVSCGLVLCKQDGNWTAGGLALIARRYAIPIGAIYVSALLTINGWFSSHWHGFGAAAVQLEQIRFMPFYYHYFSSEARALVSLTAVCLSYVPLALFAWAYRRSPPFAMAAALLLATIVEGGKLFQTGAHPDTTAIALAGATAWLAVRLMQQMSSDTAKPTQPDPMNTTSLQRPPFPSALPIWLILCLAATGIWAAAFPAFPLLLCLVLVACAAIVWHRPVWVFAVMAAALPVFDLAPWSGRFFLEEFDAILIVSMAIAYARSPSPSKKRTRSDAVFAVTATLLGLSFAISAVRGLLPFQWPDANSFNNYYSPYNALRIIKGGFWAVLAYGLAKRFIANQLDPRRPFVWGMSLGLALTVAVILWERVAFSGLWDFSGGYRVTGPFSALHVGGAYIECFLAAATPFLIVLMHQERRWLVRIPGLLLLLSTTYALMVTYSRNGYSAFAVAVFLVLATVTLQSKRLMRSAAIFAALAGGLLLVAVPIFKGEFAQMRLARVSADLDIRQAHWKDALSIRDADWATTLLGMGLGRYPETNYWRSTEGHRSATYRLESTAGNTFLRLSAGDSLYVEQLVAVEPGQHYVLRMDVRPSRPDSKITIPICEKWMLTSYNCIWQTIELGKDSGAWRKVETQFTAKGLAISPWYSHRPIKFSLFYDVPNSTMDIDNIRLETAAGTNLLSNGDFSDRMDHWFFSTDGHLQWHIKSLFYGVLFDQGVFGLVALTLFVLLALVRATRNMFNGDTISGAGFAALSSFLVVGLFDTLIDTPRFLLLFLLLAGACCLPLAKPEGKAA